MVVNKEEFAERVAEAILNSTPQVSLRIDRQSFCLHMNDNDIKAFKVVALGKHYHEYSNNPDRLEAILSSIILAPSASDAVPNSFEAAKERLCIHIQDRWNSEQLRLSRDLRLPLFGAAPFDEDIDFPYLATADHFAIVVAYDAQDTRYIINSSQLNSWGMTFIDVFKFAAVQLFNRSSDEFAENCVELPGGMASNVWKSVWHDGYDAVRVFFASHFKRLPVQGRLVAFIPDSGQLNFTGFDDMFGMAACLTDLEKARESGGKRLPPFPIVFDDEDVCVKCDISFKHSMYRDFKLEQDYYWDAIYREQAEMLRSSSEIQRSKLNIAGFHHFTKDPTSHAADDASDKQSFSVCTVMEGCENLLPSTDLVQFAQRTTENNFEIVACGHWDTVMNVCDKLVEPNVANFYPFRHKILKFPTAAQLKMCDTNNFRADVY